MSTDPGSTHYVGDGCQPAHDPRIDQAPPEVWPHPTYIELERQVEQLQSALCVSEQQTADAEELWRADVKRLSEEVQRLRAARVEQNDEYLSLQQEVERWKSAHDTCCDGGQKLVAEVERLREALQQIKEEGGKVCAEFEVCRHVACQSSVAAWMIADAALARDKANYL
jgi:predicted RNase H-like nuclease (RuvC/YqgF family)